LTTLQAAKGIVFRTTQPGYFSDWHNAPRRQFVITLSGEVEIGLEDGSKHRYGAGHVTLAEDLTGKGHTTRVVGNQPRMTATIPLGDA
jgi:quercetin dioxygenase-like cupin family protein